MDRNFAKCLGLVLKHEGGWADNPKDPGGATMKGVTLANFRRFVKPNATKEDLRKITDEQLATVYRRHYWDAVLGAQLPDGLDHAVFDYAVNSGPSRAVKSLQKVLEVRQDGKVGPVTLAAMKEAGSILIDKLCDERLAFLKRAKGSAGQLKGKLLWPTFGKGWAARVARVRKEAYSIAAQPTPEKPAIIDRVKEVPVVPKKVEQEVRKDFNLWGIITAIFSGGGLGALGLAGMDWQSLLALGALALVFLLLFAAFGLWIVRRVKAIRAEYAA